MPDRKEGKNFTSAALELFKGAEKLGPLNEQERHVLRLLLADKARSGIMFRLTNFCLVDLDPASKEESIDPTSVRGAARMALAMHEEVRTQFFPLVRETAILLGISFERFQQLADFIIESEVGW